MYFLTGTTSSCFQITTSRPGIRLSYRRRGTIARTTTTKPNAVGDSVAKRAPSSRGGSTKPIRRRTTPRTSSTVSGSRIVESQGELELWDETGTV